MFGMLLLAAVIAANDLTAGLGLGSFGRRKARWTIAPIFAVTGFVVSWLAISAGREAALRLFGLAAPRIAPFVLVVLGLAMVWGALRHDVRTQAAADRAASPGGAVLLSLALAFDDAMVGLSFGLKAYEPVSLALVIAAASSISIFVGMTIGDRVAEAVERQAQALSGVLVLALGAAMSLDLV